MREDSHIFRNTYVTGRPQTGRNLYRGYCNMRCQHDTCQRAFSGILFVAQHSPDCAAMAQAEGAAAGEVLRVCCMMRARHICRISPGR